MLRRTGQLVICLWLLVATGGLHALHVWTAHGDAATAADGGEPVSRIHTACHSQCCHYHPIALNEPARSPHSAPQPEPNHHQDCDICAMLIALSKMATVNDAGVSGVVSVRFAEVMPIVEPVVGMAVLERRSRAPPVV